MSPWFVLGLVLVLANQTTKAASPVSRPPARLVETVHVRLRQIPVTLVPKDADTSACSSLGPDDFQLYVGGRQRGLTAFDPLSPASGAREEATISTSPLRLVLVFDEYHLGYGDCSCPLAHRSRESAFEWAREAAAALMPGDEVVVVNLGAPLASSLSTLRDPDDVFAALNSAEARVIPVSQLYSPSTRARAFSDEFCALLGALARDPGHKDVVLLSRCVEDLGDDPELLPRFAAAAQRAGATVHTVDANGLRRTSEHLAEIALNLGGFSFARGLRVTSVVQKLRTLAACRFLLSFAPAAEDDQGNPHALRVEVRRPGFDVQTVAAVGGRQP